MVWKGVGLLIDGFKNLIDGIVGLVGGGVHATGTAAYGVGKKTATSLEKIVEARLEDAEDGKVRLPAGVIRRLIRYERKGKHDEAAEKLTNYLVSRQGYSDVPVRFAKNILYDLQNSVKGKRKILYKLGYHTAKTYHGREYVIIVLIAFIFLLPLSITGAAVYTDIKQGFNIFTVIAGVMLTAAIIWFFKQK